MRARWLTQQGWPLPSPASTMTATWWGWWQAPMQADDRMSVRDHHHSLFLNNTVLVSHREIHPVLLSARLVDVYTDAEKYEVGVLLYRWEHCTCLGQQCPQVVECLSRNWRVHGWIPCSLHFKDPWAGYWTPNCSCDIGVSACLNDFSLSRAGGSHCHYCFNAHVNGWMLTHSVKYCER